MGDGEKRCSQCRKLQPLTDYWREGNGHRDACIVCSKKGKRIRGPAPPLTAEQLARKRERERAKRAAQGKAPLSDDDRSRATVQALANDPTPSAERWLLVRVCRRCKRPAKVHAMQVICNACEPRATEQDKARQKRWESKKEAVCTAET